MPQLYARTKPSSVVDNGAAAGGVLRGAGMNNQGLRLRISQDQARGQSGPIRGDFVILEVGDNIHAATLARLVQRTTDAQEVVHIIRQAHPACVNVANANILIVEPVEQCRNEPAPRIEKLFDADEHKRRNGLAGNSGEACQ